jgi:hypothetical protein
MRDKPAYRASPRPRRRIRFIHGRPVDSLSDEFSTIARPKPRPKMSPDVTFALLLAVFAPSEGL